MLDIEAEATVLRERAGYGDDDVPGAVALAGRLHVRVRRVDATLLRGADACLFFLAGQAEIAIRRGLTPERMHWSVAHELAEMRLVEIDYREADVERQANALGAALLMPRAAFRAALRDHGGSLDALATGGLDALSADFLCDQTATALRLAEVHALELAVVTTPARVYARAPEEWVLPSEREIRRGVLGAMPGIRSIRLTDARKRMAFVA